MAYIRLLLEVSGYLNGKEEGCWVKCVRYLCRRLPDLRPLPVQVDGHIVLDIACLSRVSSSVSWRFQKLTGRLAPLDKQSDPSRPLDTQTVYYRLDIIPRRRWLAIYSITQQGDRKFVAATILSLSSTWILLFFFNDDKGCRLDIVCIFAICQLMCYNAECSKQEFIGASVSLVGPLRMATRLDVNSSTRSALTSLIIHRHRQGRAVWSPLKYKKPTTQTKKWCKKT